MKTIWANHDDRIIFAPRPEAIFRYLEKSSMWLLWSHPTVEEMSGWVFVQKDAAGKDIIIPKYTVLERPAERLTTICNVEHALGGFERLEDCPAFRSLATVVLKT